MRIAALSAALLLGVLLPAAGAEDDGFEAIKKTYLREVRDPSLEVRTGAHVTLAASGAVAALEALRQQYGTTRDPEDQQQYLIASIATTYLRDEAHLPAYEAWRRRHEKARDAWLWYRALRVEAARGDPQALVAIAGAPDRSPWLRAAALEALAAERDPAGIAAAARVFARLPPEPVARAVLLESIASVLLALRDRRGEARCRAVLSKLIRRLDLKTTSARTKLVLARRLRAIFGIDELYLEARPWLDHLLGRAETVDWGRYAPPAKNTFFGLEATGLRIGYVIDMSSSMLERVTVKELDDLKTIRRPSKRTREAKAPKEEPPPDRIDWKNVETRFDAARACLQFSLQGLRPDQYFCVIGFADKAGFVPPCTGMLRATAKNVRAMLKALDRAEAGTLFGGSTNMHGGLHRAFKAVANGMLKAYEYVEPAGIKEGCDTLFLLSDGSPCWDDWAHTSGDAVAGVIMGVNDPRQVVFGNYATAHQLVDDVKRLNLFRKAEIHCVGIGSGPVALLEAIAEAGLGRSRVVGGEVISAKDIAETMRPDRKTGEAKEIEALQGDEDPVARGRAAEKLGARKSVSAIPHLIDALDDEAPRVRKAAYKALKNATGHDVPYRHDMDYDQRTKAQKAWREWFAANEAELRKR